MPKISPTSGGARPPPTMSRAIDNKINTTPPLRRCTKGPDSQYQRDDHRQHPAEHEVEQHSQRQFTGKNGESGRIGP